MADADELALLRRRVPDALRELEQLLREVGHSRWAALLDELAAGAEAAGTGPEQRDVLRRITRLFGGMASLNDLVLQDRRGVLPEQQRLDVLRDRLHDAVADAHGR